MVHVSFRILRSDKVILKFPLQVYCTEKRVCKIGGYICACRSTISEGFPNIHKHGIHTVHTNFTWNPQSAVPKESES